MHCFGKNVVQRAATPRKYWNIVWQRISRVILGPCCAKDRFSVCIAFLENEKTKTEKKEKTYLISLSLVFLLIGLRLHRVYLLRLVIGSHSKIIIINLSQCFKPITVCVYFALLYDWFISLSSFVMIDYIGITSVSKTGDRGEEGFRQRGGMGAFCLVLLCRDITPSQICNNRTDQLCNVRCLRTRKDILI